jgi:hypothetical protein
MANSGYFINGYWWLLLAILLMFINGYCGYSKLYYHKLLVIILL